MNLEEKYSLAQWAIDHALKNGAQQVRVNIPDSRNNSFEIREKKIDNMKDAIENSLTIELYVDKKYSSQSTNRLKTEDLARFIEEAIVSTRYLAEDEYRTLPDESLYYKGGGEDLKNADHNYDSLNTPEKIDLAFKVEAEAWQKDPKIISISASYYDSRWNNLMVASNHFKGDNQGTYFGLSAGVTVNGGEARPESYWSESNIFYDNLIKTGIGTKALDRALMKIGQKKIASAKYPMLLENRNIGRLLSPVMNALTGYSLYQKNSFLIGMQGQKVFSDKLSITDDPFIISGRGSRYFDEEGLAAVKRVVFDKGVLKTYSIDTYYGKKLGMDPTSGSNSNLVFEPGARDFDALLRSMKKGILVTGFTGGNCNGSTGDFSFGIDGFLVENGERTQPVSEMNITGNMKQLWMSLVETGSDIRTDSAWRTPSLLFDNVDFSGI